MEKIIPVSELRAKLSEVTKWVESRKEPVVLTKNGRGRYVLLDIDTYNKLVQKGKKAKETQESPIAAQEESALTGPAAGFSSRLAAATTPNSESSVPVTMEHAVQPAHSGTTTSDPGGLSQSLRDEEDRILRELGFM
ncbi:MAG: type II toxin-antitoxin system Phd/YefM family antitoxin [Actinobacteria bacterium]|nr:type II toxin-antitoxin system Phd/YefM family antitoxin [Actinomycetota bacterium]